MLQPTQLLMHLSDDFIFLFTPRDPVSCRRKQFATGVLAVNKFPLYFVDSRGIGNIKFLLISYEINTELNDRKWERLFCNAQCTELLSRQFPSIAMWFHCITPYMQPRNISLFYFNSSTYPNAGRNYNFSIFYNSRTECYAHTRVHRTSLRQTLRA